MAVIDRRRMRRQSHAFVLSLAATMGTFICIAHISLPMLRSRCIARYERTGWIFTMTPSAKVNLEECYCLHEVSILINLSFCKINYIVSPRRFHRHASYPLTASDCVVFAVPRRKNNKQHCTNWCRVYSTFIIHISVCLKKM